MSDRIINATTALAEALDEEMSRDETIFILGEDLVHHGGVFGQFIGLPEKYPGRVLDTPISENCVAGCGVGAALTAETTAEALLRLVPAIALQLEAQSLDFQLVFSQLQEVQALVGYIENNPDWALGGAGLEDVMEGAILAVLAAASPGWR